jgi:hypothetical protein
MRKLLFAVAVSALIAPGVVRAEDEKSEPEGRRSVGFSSSTGLVGMRDMIDARVPSLLNIRGMLKFHHESTNVDSRQFLYSDDSYAVDVIAGASALGLVDAGLRLPMTVRIQRTAIHGGPDRSIQSEGFNDLELSGKVGFQLGPWIALGPYVTVHANTGSKLLDKRNEMHIGTCGTASILDDRIGVHVNLSNVTYSGGKWAFGYRLGASVVPFASDMVVLRLFAYLDGKDYIGHKIRGNDARLFGGVQALFFKLVTAEVSFGMKFYAGDLRSYLRDDGTYGLDIGAGISFMF